MLYYYVYVLMSDSDGLMYTGYSKDLVSRLNEHNNGKVPSIKMRRPLKLIYWEGCLHQQDATRLEKYLKSENGKIYLRKRLKMFLRIQRGENLYDLIVPLYMAMVRPHPGDV